MRFAPSPTGPLHIGGLRTALFNYLFARKHGGTFLLRIEDTDRTRYVPGAEDYIMESLKWCGIEPDEGPAEGGAFGPYRQSERREIYRTYADELVEKGEAYYAFDTPEELDRLRREAEEKKETFTYNARVRGSLNNSLNMNGEQLKEKLQSGDPYVIRFRFPENEEITMQDIIRGDISVQSGTLDDKILFKSDGMPTYHLANVVDDHLMEISHVIRGEEWLPSLPLHVAMYRAFNWEEPDFAHLPLILKPTGKGKLSKRDGDKGGFPVFPLEWKDPQTGEVAAGYRESGYFPEACINILALLGWNPGTEQELFNLEEFIDLFDLSRVGKAGAKFDPDKARWFNHQYLQKKSAAELRSLFEPLLAEKGVHAPPETTEAIIELVKERADFVGDLWDQSDYFFIPPQEYDPKVVKKRWKEQTPEHMKALMEVLKGTRPFEAPRIEERVKGFISEQELGMGAVMNAWRLLLVGASRGPDMFEMAATLGRDEVLERMQRGLQKLA